jgi:hypothetical protein
MLSALSSHLSINSRSGKGTHRGAKSTNHIGVAAKEQNIKSWVTMSSQPSKIKRGLPDLIID